MSQLQSIIKDGFNFTEKGNSEVDLAFVSLKIALKAYFSTYQTFKNQLHIFEQEDIDQPAIDFMHRNDYCEACAETIVHFQHFSELVCKKLLRDDHPLLADVALQKPILLHKLLHGENLTNEDENMIRSIEFSDTLRRLTALIRGNVISNHDELNFILKHEETLTQLNALRNRIWHRGIYILRYQSLDKFVGKYILPFVVEVMALKDFQMHTHIWKYKSIHCEIDPIAEVIDESSKDIPDTGKIALLKEIGRAAYENPLWSANKLPNKLSGFVSIFENKVKRRAERIANLEASQGYSDVTDCPVCGTRSLILYDDTEYDYEDDPERPTNIWRYTYRAVCECCSFNLETGVKNASEYGFPNIKDYWVSESMI